MTALDVITLDFVKDQILKIDFPDADDRIKGLIHAAVGLVETYTSHILYERAITVPGTQRTTKIAYYPVSVGEVTNAEGVAQTIVVNQGVSSVYVVAPYPNAINLTVGYASKEEVPGALLEACYKLIVNMYENTDIYGTSLPLDIQLLLNPYRREPTI